MANLETAVLARQPREVKKEEFLRLARLVAELLAAVRAKSATSPGGERAA
jgi:hypothetical protein